MADRPKSDECKHMEESGGEARTVSIVTLLLNFLANRLRRHPRDENFTLSRMASRDVRAGGSEINKKLRF